MESLSFREIKEQAQGHMQMAELKHGVQSRDNNYVVLPHTRCCVAA